MKIQKLVFNCIAELNSHADTCAINNFACVLEYTSKIAEVSGFSPSLDTMTNIPIVKMAVAYDNPQTGETTILVINQALYFDDQLPHLLLNQKVLHNDRR
jgi:hypothetical protein